jgi:hypothetical protein
MRIIINLKQQTILTTNKHMTNLCCLFYWIWIVETVLKIKDGEDGVTGVMVQDYGRTWQVLVFYTPETDVLLPARH